MEESSHLHSDAATVELSCTEVPLYGQVTVYGKLDKILPEDAEFYFVYHGSIQRHVAFAKHVTDNTLESIIPAHREQEEVSVSVVMYPKEGPPVTLGFSSVTYKQDTACEIACFLVSHVDCLTPSSHKTLLSRFGLSSEDFQSMDHVVTLAVAYEEMPPAWKIIGSTSEDESKHKETLLHLAMKLGLVKFSQFLFFQPGGRVAFTLPNEDGLTPLDLALQNGHLALVEMFSKKQVSHPFEISKLELGENAVLQFAHSSGTLSLTFNCMADHLLESDIQLFRKYFWDSDFRNKHLSPKQAETLEEVQMPCNSTTSAVEDLGNLVSEEPSPKNEDVTFYRDQLIQSIESEDDAGLDLGVCVSNLVKWKKLQILLLNTMKPIFFFFFKQAVSHDFASVMLKGICGIFGM